MTKVIDDHAWWRAALAGEEPRITEDPNCGYFKRRLFKGGPWVPVHIWIQRETDEAGELLSDEVIMCSVDGRQASVDDHWTYCCNQPITEREFDYMARKSAWAKAHDKREPLANPRRRIDPLSFPLPTFTQKKKGKTK